MEDPQPNPNPETNLEVNPPIPTPLPKAMWNDKIFRLLPEEDDKLTNSLIPLAYKLKCISAPSLQNYMIFALNCAYVQLKQVYEAQKGR